MLYRKYDTFKDFYLNFNKELLDMSLKGSNDLSDGRMNKLEDVVIDIDSMDLEDLDLTLLSYRRTKISMLLNKYVDNDNLQNFYNVCSTCERESIGFDFNPGVKNCIKNVVLVKDKRKKPYDRVKVFWRSTDSCKAMLADLFMIKSIIENCPNVEPIRITLYFSVIFQTPSGVVCIYDDMLGLKDKDLKGVGSFARSVNLCLGYRDNYVPGEKSLASPVTKIWHYKYELKQGNIPKPIYYEEFNSVYKERKLVK
ncbi:MAG: hypothetical protein ACRCR2_03650 [Fusobacteriaceae bacterium]